MARIHYSRAFCVISFSSLVIFAPTNLERKAPREPLGKAGGEPERAPRFVPTRVGLRWSRGRGLIRLFSLIACGRGFENSATGTRTRVARVRAEYPSQLDYSGSDHSAVWQIILVSVLLV